MVMRLNITIEQEEYSKLLDIALDESRTVEAQICHIMREELRRREAIQENRIFRSSQLTPWISIVLFIETQKGERTWKINY